MAGLHFMHMCKNTTHGYVKPDNLLIQQGGLKVESDFGLATVRCTMTKLTGDVSRKGTSSFLAPEMLLGERGATQSAIDVWGLGCCMASKAKTCFLNARVSKNWCRLCGRNNPCIARNKRARAARKSC